VADSTRSDSGGWLPTRIAVPLAVGLFVLFVILLFPWDAVGRRIAYEISRASGARVDVPELAPAITSRGPVLRARRVTIEHPAIDRVELFTLEIAPRLSTSWLGGEPTLRVWAESGLGNVDGRLRLGPEPAYLGRVTGVELSRLPLRLEASGVRLRGEIEADADVALDPGGTLQGHVDFESPSLEIESNKLPVALPFTHATGRVEILESGATRIDGVVLEGVLVSGELSGEIGLVHRSQSPPVELQAKLRIVDPNLRRLAPAVGLELDGEGRAHIAVRGTLDAPEISPYTNPTAARRGTGRAAVPPGQGERARDGATIARGGGSAPGNNRGQRP
jgi:type II secretion system protein N